MTVDPMDTAALHTRLNELATKLGFDIATEKADNSYQIIVSAPIGKVWANSKTPGMTVEASASDEASRAGVLGTIIDHVEEAISRSPDGSGFEPLIQLATTVAEVDPKAAVADMKNRIAALATDDMGTRVALAAVIDLTREQFQLMLGAVPPDMHDIRRAVSGTLNALDAELMLQFKLMRERRPDGRGGGLR